MPNRRIHLVAAVGVLTTVAAFRLGKSQPQIVFVPTERVVYVNEAQEKKRLQHQKYLESVRAKLHKDASLIAPALLTYAKAQRFYTSGGATCFGSLPSKSNIDGGCLNAYSGGALAQSYSRQGLLLLSFPNDHVTLGENIKPDDQPSNPCGVYNIPHIDVARLQNKSKELTIFIMGDGRVSD